MFPTFISILDIQSWWEVPSIAHFCSLFRSAFNLLDFDIEDLEEALLTDGTEETSWLQELIVRLLSGCLPNNEISTFNYQMFLRRLFRQKCQEHDCYNPFNTDIDFQLLPLRTKVDILHSLCDFRLDADDVLDQLKNLEADSLRVEPLGYDANESAYWYFYGTRLYREDFKTKNNKRKSVWQVICFTEDDWFQLTKKLKKTNCKSERQLHHTLSENFLPELPRLFKEKESLARKRLLENQPRRTSNRLRKLESETEKELVEKVERDAYKEKSKEEEEAKARKRSLDDRRQEAYDRRTKLKEQSEGSLSDASIDRDEMAGPKTKKIKGKQRRISDSSSNGKDNSLAKNSQFQSNERNSSSKSSSSKLTPVGRQTNNSLSAATGQILIQPLTNPKQKIPKTSQLFRQTDDDLQIGMHKILDFVKNDEDAWPFADPVEEEYAPNYYTVIRKPMDLQRMEERLDSGYYKTFSKFQADFQLIVDNCRLYNGAENEYTQMVGNLLQVFKKATEKYLDQISSSEDEIATEVSNARSDVRDSKIEKASDVIPTSRRKPMLAAQTDEKRDRSVSESSLSSRRSKSYESKDMKSAKFKKSDDVAKKQTKINKSKKASKKEKFETKKGKSETKKYKYDNKKDKYGTKREKCETKKEKSETKKTNKDPKSKSKKSSKKGKKKVRKRSLSRSLSRSSVRSDGSSPPPSWPPSSPDSRFDVIPKKNPKKRYSQDLNDSDDSLKGKQQKYGTSPLFKSIVDVLPEKVKEVSTPPLSPRPKDKHNKLRETIEKLKAKSEIKLKNEFDFDIDHLKENRDRSKKEKEDKIKPKIKDKQVQKLVKKETELDLDANSTMDSMLSESKKAKKKCVISVNNKSASNMDALSIATEQTLKDINKWLDDTPKFSEFSSASNSPSYTGLDEFDTVAVKIDLIPGKKMDKIINVKKEGGIKEVKKKPFRDPAKFFKRREIQRTIDRLQPGKSKGNLILNVQNNNKVDEIFPLGPLSKIKDTKNSLIVKTDTNAPKLSLGSVLDSFGKHKFVDEQKKEEINIPVNISKKENQPATCAKDSSKAETENKKVIDKEIVEVKEDKKNGAPAVVEDANANGGATPNLSAWFKAFGAPKMQPPTKKSDVKSDVKDADKPEDTANNKVGKVALPVVSPNTDSTIITHGQPIPRQRKISTGSSMSERSSFSQDMDSPRVGIDERGAYPAPYPSPLHKSPSGASPVMASPRADISPRATAYPTINGQIRVGFYQDTVSNKSSPDKSCSPHEIPQSPHPNYSEHVYAPNTTEGSFHSYTNSPYYTQAPNYTTACPTPTYNMEGGNPPYYDTSKSLTDQYQKKNAQNYTAGNHSSPIPHPQQSPKMSFQHSPNINPLHCRPLVHSQHSPIYPQHSPQLSPGIQPQFSPRIHPQHSPNIHPQNSPVIHQNSPETEAFQSQAQRKELPDESMLLQQQQQQSQCAIYPAKKRSYNDSLQNSSLLQKETGKNNHVSEAAMDFDTTQLSLNGKGEERPKSYVHQNIPDLKPVPVQSSADSEQQTLQVSPESTNTYPSTPTSTFGSPFGNESNQLNIPSSRNLTPSQQNKIDMSKYTNMGYTGPDLNFTRPLQQFNRPELNYTCTTTSSPGLQKPPTSILTSSQSTDLLMRYSNPNSALQQMGYKSMELSDNANPQQAHTNFSSSTKPTESITDRSPQVQEVPSGYKPDVTVPRASYNASSLDVDLSLSLGRNLSHIVDRFTSDERMIAGLQTTASYYTDKGLGTSHILNKQISTGASALPMFSQANMAAMQSYNQNMQVASSSMYRQMTDLQNVGAVQNDVKMNLQSQLQEKKNKKRKSKTAAPTNAGDTQQPNPTNQGFQSYAGLKGNSSMEPNAISLKTSSVVPGSAFNFGPTPTSLGIGAGLYGDKDAFPNLLEEFRAAPNYYMAAATAAHHRSTTEACDKQTRAAHQSSNPQTSSSYPFLTAPQTRSTYPIGGPFIPNAQGQLMDTSSPLYQHYLQAGVLNQGLLGPPGAYPAGYHPALSMRQPYDPMTRPSWL